MILYSIKKIFVRDAIVKRMKCVVSALIGLSALTAAFSAIAAMPVPTGWYVDGNVGSSRLSNANFGSGTSSSTSGLGYNINGGFKFMPYFAAEVGATKYANTSIKASGVGVAKDTNYSYDLTGKAILPIVDSGVDLFAKLGIMRLNSHITTSNAAYISQNSIDVNLGTHMVTGAYIGVGGDYNISQNLAALVQWQRAKGNSTTGYADLYSIGIGYNFG